MVVFRMGAGCCRAGAPAARRGGADAARRRGNDQRRSGRAGVEAIGRVSGSRGRTARRQSSSKGPKLALCRAAAARSMILIRWPHQQR